MSVNLFQQHIYVAIKPTIWNVWS